MGADMWNRNCVQFPLNAANVNVLMAQQFIHGKKNATKKLISECHSHRQTWTHWVSRIRQANSNYYWGLSERTIDYNVRMNGIVIFILGLAQSAYSIEKHMQR